MRLAKNHDDPRLTMILPELGDLFSRMAVASADPAHVRARNTVQPVDRNLTGAGALQQIVERLPGVSPVGVEVEPVTQFLFIDLVLGPLVENVLIAGEDRFQSKYHGPTAMSGEVFHHLGSVRL